MYLQFGVSMFSPVRWILKDWMSTEKNPVCSVQPRLLLNAHLQSIAPNGWKYCSSVSSQTNLYYWQAFIYYVLSCSVPLPEFSLFPNYLFFFSSTPETEISQSWNTQLNLQKSYLATKKKSFTRCPLFLQVR